MRIGSLCSGYGGLDLGLASVIGGSTAWLCEYDKHPSTILDQRFPGVPNYGDITTTDWSRVEPVDWITAGYPCQPFSHAGKRQGTRDERHIWPHVAECIRLVRPGHVLLENVAGHLSLGFGDVLGDLAALGYDARWGVLRAADVGAPHGRKRVFIVATDTTNLGHERRGDSWRWWAGLADGGGTTPDAERGGRDGRSPVEVGGSQPRVAAARSGEGFSQWGTYAPAIHRWELILGREAPAPTEPGRNGPRLSPRFVEFLMGLPAGWVTEVGIPRNAQLKALGNGAVPQQAAAAVRWLTAERVAA
jgi:DNA (cytosine-5)-methyltransferase 1